jgi:hypothetical protein
MSLAALHDPPPLTAAVPDVEHDQPDTRDLSEEADRR